MKKSSYKFIFELSNLVFFWFVGIIFFFFFRIFFVYINKADLSDNIPFSDFFDSLLMGFRFDSTVISYFLIIPFLSLYILPLFRQENRIPAIRVVFQYLFIISSTLICVINLNYYREFKDQFNHFLFLGLYDDKKAVLQSILNYYNPLLNIFVVIFLIVILIKIFSFFKNKTFIASFLNFFNFKYEILFFKFIFIILFFVSIRGSFTEYPARRFYSSVSSDDFLNKTIINPFRALNYAISDFNILNSYSKTNPFGDITKSINIKHRTIKEILKKDVIEEKLKEKPKQIFLIVMESYDAWFLKKDYSFLEVSNSLKEIEKKSVSYKNFIPAANSTMNSLAGIISGVPHCGINISKIGALRLFESSIFKQFKKLGYETNIFFTSFSSWQNLGNFAKGQGVDNVFDATSSSSSKGIWGLNDENLFNNVLEKIDSNKKSINIILTISYHTPYEVDVFKEGFNFTFNYKKNSIPSPTQIKYSKELLPHKVLGHLWYADRSIGRFVKKAEIKYKNSLFAFTGDHYSRKFINSSPTLMERSSVPFIIYSNSLNIKTQKSDIPGSHIDITPTLIELIAPKNFTYYSFGNSLLKNNKLGIGFNKTISENIIYEFSKGTKTKKQILKDVLIKKDIQYANKKAHDSLMSLAWHYTIKGDTIK